MSGTVTPLGASSGVASADDPLDYCRRIEAHLCQKNGGHLVRVVGPSFEVVSTWQRDGIPLKVACEGVDRAIERFHRKGPRRRPMRIEFCDADVRSVFDQWRRATGVVAASGGAGLLAEARRGPSLPEHLERALLRLSSAFATGRVGDAIAPIIDGVSSALDEARAASGGLRGDKRQALLAHLGSLDDRLAAIAGALILPDARLAFECEVDEELHHFRADMPAQRFERARGTALDRKVRVHLGLPVLRFT